MAITKVKNYNIAPYYDDFDETKNYHRIQFRPGHAVQARELTQLQTALQAQIDKLGQYSFKDGSRVVAGKTTLNVEYDFIKLTNASFTHSSTTYNTTYQDANLANFVGTTITGTAQSGNQVSAKVLQAVAASGSDPNTLYIVYENSGGANKTVEKFSADEVFTSSGGTSYVGKVGASGVTPTGEGSAVSIEEGVYFISGCFVHVAAETIILDKYTNTPTYIVGLSITETYNVDNSTDTSLADNAQGTPNYSAPGAHRYKISTALIKESVTAPHTTYSNYILLMEINAGIVTVEDSEKFGGTELTSRLARRTHEESGNYAVRPFQLDIREHLDDGAGNGGYLTSGNGGVATKLAIGVEPSVAYVQGHRVENLATKYVAVDKPRGFVNENQQQIELPIGNKVGVTISSMRGMPDIDNYAHATLADGGGNIGTCRIRGVELWNATKWSVYIYDIVMDAGESFSTVTTITQTNGAGQNFTGTLSPTGTIYRPGDNGLVFPLTHRVVKTLLTDSDEPEYVVRKRVQANVTGTGNSAYVTFQSFGGTVNSTSDILIAVGGNAPVQCPVSCVTTSTSTLTITNTNGDLDGTGFHTGTPHVQVIFSVKRNSSNSLKADKTRVTVAAANFTYASATGYIPLDKSDIIKINTVTIAGVDKSADFTLDNGQRDNFYDEGRLYPIGSLANGTVVNISFDHYSHSTGDYFTVDSYPTNDYETIPQFNGTQGTLELRDCIDFRPTKGVDPSSASAAFTSGDGEQLSSCPQPDSDLAVDVSHYLPRIDKLYVKRNGDFEVVSGIADSKPKKPVDPDDAMVIYELHFAPYVFGPNDLAAVKIDNKRYTMRDIGSLDKRIKNLEYYTSLSLLEQQASDTQIYDGVNSRLKNGFVVDGFYGHNVGNIIHNDYHVSIDKTMGVLRPKFYEDSTNLVRFSSDSGTVVKNGSILTLPFTHSEYAKQPYATTSEFVNPYNVFSWDGQCTLSPESDEWKDTETRPDITIDNEGIYDQLVQQAEDSGLLGTVWGEWQTNWSGVEISTLNNDIGWGAGGNSWAGDFGREFMWVDNPITTTMTATTTTQNQSRDGMVTTVVPSTELKSLGSRVVETNFIPFIRSREIFFKAELLKPNTKVYAFFNGTDVTNYCSETGGYKEWSDQTDIISYKDATVHAANTDLVTNGVGRVEGSFRIPSNSTTKFKTGTREFRLTDSSTNDKSTETTSAEALYHAQGMLEVMQNVIQSTKVPKFVTSEISENRVVTDTRTRRERTRWVDPVAQTFLVEQEGGLFVTKLDLFINTKDPEIPLNVSIRAVENGYPTQRVVPGTDVNIYPGADRDAVGDGLGDNIQVSTDGSVATTVTFDYPVYLGQDQEYAIVLIANSDAYKVFIAETGGLDLADTSNRVTKQPYDGVFFTSANASTWTAEQMRDLKFTLYRANFSANSGTATLVNDAIPTKKLGPDPFRFVRNVSGDAVIRVTHKNHGMHGANAKVTISGYVDGHNGLAAAAVNATHTISEQELDSYTITIDSDTATTTSIDGGGTAIYATEDKQYNILYPSIQTLEVPGTSISYSLEAQSGKSIDGAESGYVKQAVGGILANVNNQFSAPLTIASTVNETQYTGDSSAGNKSLVLTCTFNGNSYLSPVLDANRCSVDTITNRLNNATSTVYNDSDNGRTYVADTVAQGCSNLNSYLTKRIDLNDEADVLDVYLNVNRPKDSNIDLYYKHMASGSDVDFDTELSWVLATPDSAIPTNDGGGYFEAHYAIDPLAYTSPYPNVKFGSFAFKIVLRSTNSSNVPTVKDFRAVAAT